MEAVVDITTKDLYDRIDFSDLDGGAWKQGWEVKYIGDEWDDEKLKVFVVPHSHNDPGWKMTVEEYYNTQSRHILDTIVDVLSKVYAMLRLIPIIKLRMSTSFRLLFGVKFYLFIYQCLFHCLGVLQCETVTGKLVWPNLSANYCYGFLDMHCNSWF